MTRRTREVRRGLTTVELILALAITGLVGAAMSGMMHAVAVGVSDRGDTRSIMVRTATAQARLNAYLAPSRCVLSQSGANLVIWLEDSRKTETVHASELRWIRFDADAGTVSVEFVKLPDAWTVTARELEDAECSMNSDWEAVRTKYQTGGHLKSLRLLDQVQAMSVALDQADPIDSRRVSVSIDFETSTGVEPALVESILRLHQAPMR